MSLKRELQLYQMWLSYPNHPVEIQRELESIRGDDTAIRDRFYKDLEFGTGGLRGVLGAGTNRMNVYTVRKATLGLARYILRQKGAGKPDGVVIGYDCRRMSSAFAREAGLVLAKQGIRAYVFPHLCPTPELSYAVRELGAAAGIMITASHNPPEYNGYKVYGRDGGQLLPDAAELVLQEIGAIEDAFSIPVAELKEAEEAGLFAWVGSEVDQAYVERVVQDIRVNEVSDDARRALKIIYTPLHGTGNLPVRQALQQAGYQSVQVVPEQAEPDGEFCTVKSPNPEEHAAFEMALALAKQNNADIVLATDPDADRVGVAVRDGDQGYRLLTGNQTGGLLVDFILQTRSNAGTLPKDGIVFKTIVTSELGARAAQTYGIAVEDTLTGFKYIGERISHYEKTGEYTFLFGYEESYGYLAAPFVRDKDAVQSCLLIAEMAAWYKASGATLCDALEALFGRVGYHQEELVSITLPGADGVEKIQAIMANLRSNGITVDGLDLKVVEDYVSRERIVRPADEAFGAGTRRESITLPKADVLKYVFEGGAWLAVRPSGTEPKLKVYYGATSDSQQACTSVLNRMKDAVKGIIAI